MLQGHALKGESNPQNAVVENIALALGEGQEPSRPRLTVNPVLLPALFVVLGAERFFLAVADGSDAIGENSFLHQRSLHRLRAAGDAPVTRYLERKSNRQNAVVITCMKVSRGDLISAAHGKADSSPQAKATHYQTRCHEICFLAIILSILKEC